MSTTWVPFWLDNPAWPVPIEIEATHLTTDSSTTNATSYVTASISPTANRLVLLAIGTARNDTNDIASMEPTVTGCGLTWVLEDKRIYNASEHVVYLYRAMSASPSAGAITISFGAVTMDGCEWSVNEFSGVDTGGTNGSAACRQSVGADADTGTSRSITLAAFGDAANATYGCFRHGATESTTPGTGFTELGETSRATPAAALQTEWRNDNDTTVDASWATSSANCGIAVEIKVAPAPPAFTGWGIPI